MNLGKRLKEAREARSYTQEQLAGLVPGSSQAMISALESRDSETTTLLFGFAQALQVSPAWLQDGAGESGLNVPIGGLRDAPAVIPKEELDLLPLAPDEITLLKLYRNVSPSHRLLALNLLKATREQRDLLSEELLAKIFTNHVPDTVLGDKWSRPDAEK